MKFLLFAAPLLLLPVFSGFACFSTPQEQIVPAEELVERTSLIILAYVVEAKANPQSGEVTYSFQTTKAIKGKDPETFTILGAPLLYPEDLTTFDHHRSDAFWQGDAGRCRHDTDCKIHPAFAVGSSYLIFIDEPYHRKSFEHIAMLGRTPETRDKWLSWVENTVKTQQADSEQPATNPESKPEDGQKPPPESEGRSR